MMRGLLELFVALFGSIGPIILLVTFWLDVQPPNRWWKWFIRVCKFLTFVIIGLVLLRLTPMLLVMATPAIVFGMVLIKSAVPNASTKGNAT